MKRNKSVFIASTLGLGLMQPLAAQADNINVNFTATVTVTTCRFVIDTSVSPNTKSSSKAAAVSIYTLTMPNVSLDKIISGDSAAESNFTIIRAPGSCSPGISVVEMKLKGFAGYSGKLIKNDLTGDTAAANIGMGIRRQSDSGDAFFTPDNATTVTWSSDEIANGMPLTVALRKIDAGGATTTGLFDATAVFNIIYR
ncbi:TPA: fimbrial protein [Salmonella enterica subsp. salamae serovar 28:r:e,n,z15]|nr:fimbrial protein [Salmonella enterica subsp. salamae serovar 28:r:e,n,z15]